MVEEAAGSSLPIFHQTQKDIFLITAIFEIAAIRVITGLQVTAASLYLLALSLNSATLPLPSRHQPPAVLHESTATTCSRFFRCLHFDRSSVDDALYQSFLCLCTSIRTDKIFRRSTSAQFSTERVLQSIRNGLVVSGGVFLLNLAAHGSHHVLGCHRPGVRRGGRGFRRRLPRHAGGAEAFGGAGGVAAGEPGRAQGGAAAGGAQEPQQDERVRRRQPRHQVGPGGDHGAGGRVPGGGTGAPADHAQS